MAQRKVPGKIVNMPEEDHEKTISASDQLRVEIHNVITRMSKESDLTVYQVLGCLEIVKLDIVENLERFKE